MTKQSELVELVGKLPLPPKERAIAVAGAQKMTEARAAEVMQLFIEAAAAGEAAEASAESRRKKAAELVTEVARSR
jgi:hypothetical protein